MNDAVVAAVEVPALFTEIPAGEEILPAQDRADDAAAKEFSEALYSREAELWLYRDRTAGMLRRYGRLSVEVGRVPSLLGREFFQTKVTSYRVATFEDAVIFVHDVEQALEDLDWFDRQLIGDILLLDYTQEDAARLMGCGLRTVNRRFPEALDRVSELFLEGGLLARLAVEPMPGKSCQEGESDEICLSDCEQSENKI